MRTSLGRAGTDTDTGTDTDAGEAGRQVADDDPNAGTRPDPGSDAPEPHRPADSDTDPAAPSDSDPHDDTRPSGGATAPRAGTASEHPAPADARDTKAVAHTARPRTTAEHPAA